MSQTEIRTTTPGKVLWRVGRKPEPWAWIDWRWAGEQRWDDFEHEFRTVYAAESPYTCFVEILAHYRPDPNLVADMAGIDVDPIDAAHYGTPPAGQIPRNWVDTRLVSSARVDGTFCDVTAAESIATLRPTFLLLATLFGLPDFDASTLKAAQPREITQRVASWLYEHQPDGGDLIDGIFFRSRHGDEMSMWAIFERPGDVPWSKRVSIQTETAIALSDVDLERAFRLHNLTWEPR